MGSSVPVWFGAAVSGGLAANFGLMQLNALHPGCANLCTLCQFGFGAAEGLLTPARRRTLFARRLPMASHLAFAGLFFLGPYLGNRSVAITGPDFYPVFLVVRSCGSAAAMGLGALVGRRYAGPQVGAVLLATGGAAVATLGCYYSSDRSVLAVTSTGPGAFAAGVGLLLANLLVDAGLAVYQAAVFGRHGRHVEEAVMISGLLGTLLMALVAGRAAWGFLVLWVSTPRWYPVLGWPVPLELALLTLNFVGNWNAKKLCTWLTANSSAVLSSLVPMLYRLISTVLATQIGNGGVHPATWVGVACVFGGSLGYVLASVEQRPAQKLPHLQ